MNKFSTPETREAAKELVRSIQIALQEGWTHYNRKGRHLINCEEILDALIEDGDIILYGPGEKNGLIQ